MTSRQHVVHLTSADVDQCCCGFHECQLSVADQALGFRAQIDRQHDKVWVPQQVIHVLAEPRPNCLLIFNTPEGQREKMKVIVNIVSLILCFKMFNFFGYLVTVVIFLYIYLQVTSFFSEGFFFHKLPRNTGPLHAVNCSGLHLSLYFFYIFKGIKVNIRQKTFTSWSCCDTGSSCQILCLFEQFCSQCGPFQ